MLKMKKQSPYITLKPFKLADENQLNKLLENISTLTKCDDDVFSQIRDFFFQISSSDFDKMTQKYSPKFFKITNVIFHVNSSQFGNSDAKYKLFRTSFLSLMTYINYKFLNPSVPRETFDLLSKQISEASIEDLNITMKIILLSFETRDPESTKYCQQLMNYIYPSIKNRFFDLIKEYDKISTRTLISSLNLLNMIASSKQFVLQNIREFEKLLKYESPNKIPHSNLISIFTLQTRVASILSPIDNSMPIVQTIIRIMLKTPPSVSSIIVNSASILLNHFKTDTEHRIEPMIKLFPLILNHKLWTTDTLHAYFAVIQFVFEQMQSRQKFTSETLLLFCKYIASMLHFRKATINQCSSRFNSIYSKIKLPSTPNSFRNSLISLFMFSFGVGFMELEQQIVRMMNMMNGQKELLFTFTALLSVGESYFRLMKFLSQTVEIISQCDSFKGKPLLSSVSSPLFQIDFRQLVDLLVRSLIILMIYREALNKIIEMVRYIEPSSNPSDYNKLCTQQVKASRTYDRSRSYHLHSAQQMISCIASLPSHFSLIIWDSFFETFFSGNNSIGLDSYTFRPVVCDPRVFPIFFTSITSFICNKIRNGYNITTFLKSMQIIFEKLSVKPSTPPKSLDNIDRIFNEANKVISACKEMISDPQYCSDILIFLSNFTNFIDFVSGNNRFSSQLLSDNFISFIIKNVSLVPFTQKSVVEFLLYVEKKNQQVFRNSCVIDFLINSLTSEFNPCLFLLSISMKQDKNKFFRHPSMIKFYVALLHALDTVSSDVKNIILKFLRRIPVKQIKNLDHVSDTLLQHRSIILQRGDHKAIFECNSLIKSIRVALFSNIENNFLWDFLEKIIHSFSDIENWTAEQHRFFYQIMITVLHVYVHAQKELYSLKKRASNNIGNEISSNESNINSNRNNNSLAQYLDNKMSSILKTDNLVVKSHFLLSACCMYSKPPKPILIVLLSDIKSKEMFANLISNILSIIDILSYSTKVILPSLCFLLRNIKIDYIDPISYALLVHRTVIDSYSSEWVVEQHYDLFTSFFELNYLSETSLKLINFCRELLAGSSVSITPLLNILKYTTLLLPILVGVEMISRNENIEEIYAFLDDFLATPAACYEYGDSRILGPLSRAFPVILEKYSDRICSILKDGIANISKMTRNHQGLFLVILVPVLNSNLFKSYINYETIFTVCNQFLNIQSPLLKCQAQQVYHALFKHGPEEITQKIQQHFEQLTKTPPKSNFLKWAPLIDVAFTYFPIFPKKVLSIALSDLELIINGVSMPNYQQTTNSSEFLKAILSNLNFLSSEIVVKLLITNKVFESTAKHLISIFNHITYLHNAEASNYLLKFFEKSNAEFPVFFNNSLENELILSFFACMIENQRMKAMFLKYRSQINITPATIQKHPILVLIVLKTIDILKEVSSTYGYGLNNLNPTDNSASQNNQKSPSDPLVEKITDVGHQMIDNFDQNFMLFKPAIIKEIVIYFASNNVNTFLQLALHALSTNSPLMTALFSQSALPEIPLDVFLNMQYSDKNDVNFSFLEAFLMPILQRHPEWLDKIIEFLHENFQIPVFLQFINILYNLRILNKQIPYDPYEIYKKCDTDELQLQSILYWGFYNLYTPQSQTDNEKKMINQEVEQNPNETTFLSQKNQTSFVEMFKIFASFFTIHPAFEIRAVSDSIKIPKELYNNDEICSAMLNLFSLYNRSFSILIHILAIYLNNRDAFKKIERKIWEYFQEQAMSLVNPKKANIQTYKTSFVFLTRLIPTHGPLTDNENSLAQKLIIFANSILSFNKEEEKIKTETLLKLRGSFLKSIINLSKIAAPQCEFIHSLISFTCESYQKMQAFQQAQSQQVLSQTQQVPKISSIQQQQQQIQQNENEIALFDLLIHSLPEFIETLLYIENFPEFEKISDIIIEIAKSTSSNWPVAILCISNFLSSDYYKEKIATKILSSLSTELLAHSFPLLWNNPLTEGFRISHLVPFAIKYCRTYSEEKPVEMLLSDTILSIIFESSNEPSSIYYILKECKNCMDYGTDPENAVFFTRVLIRALISMQKANKNVNPSFQHTIERKVFKILGDNRIHSLFAAKPCPLNKDTFNKLSLNIKLSAVKYLLPNFGNEILEIIENKSFDIIDKNVDSKDVPLAFCLMNFFSYSNNENQENEVSFNIIDVLKFVIQLPPRIVISLYYQLKSLSNPKNQSEILQYPLQTTIKTGVNTAQENIYYINKLSDWDRNKNEIKNEDNNKCIRSNIEIADALIRLGHESMAQDIILESVNLLEPYKINEIFNNHDQQIEELYEILCSGPQTPKNYLNELMPIVERANYFATANTFPSLMIIRQMKYFIAALGVNPNLSSASGNSSSHNLKSSGMKLFKYELSPIFEPELHEKYALLRNKIREIIANPLIHTSGNNNMYQFEKVEIIHQKNLRKSKSYHFQIEQNMEANLQELIINNSIREQSQSQQENEKILRENILNGLKKNKTSNIFLSASIPILEDIIDEFLNCYSPDSPIPFKWSQLISEIYSSSKIKMKLAPIIHPAFKCYFLESETISDANTRNLMAFIGAIQMTIKSNNKCEKIKEKHQMETKLAQYLRSKTHFIQNSSDMSKTIINTDDLSSTFKDDCLKMGLFVEENECFANKSILIKSISLQRLPAPLLPIENAQIYSAAFFLSNPKNNYISITTFLSNGEITPYIITPFKTMDTRLATFFSVITSSILHKSPNNYGKGQNITSIPSYPLNEDFYLAQTSSEPYISISQLPRLIDAVFMNDSSSKQNSDQEQHLKLNYSSQKDFYDWFWHFSVRFGALSTLQIINEIEIFNPYSLVIDYKTASISLINIDHENESPITDLLLLRLCGKMKSMIDSTLLQGPFTFSFISTADTLNFHSKKFKFFNQTILNKDSDQIAKEIDNLKQYSVFDTPITTIQDNLSNLIERSSNFNSLFAIPWI